MVEAIAGKNPLVRRANDIQRLMRRFGASHRDGRLGGQLTAHHIAVEIPVRSAVLN